MAKATQGEVFGSRFAFVAAGISMAVGTGNVWRFPRDVGEWGGGAFLFAVVVANLVWAIPLLMAEAYMGSKTRLGTVGAFRDLMGRKFAWMGGFMGFATIAIMFYYSVVCGWAIRYFVYAITGRFSSGVGVSETEGLWNNFTSTPWQTILFHAIAIGIVGSTVYRGLKGGMETILNITVPVLFVILAILAIRAMTLPGSVGGLQYIFVPEWSRLGAADVWLQAFAQMAFSTGAGWGLYLTYSVYMRRREDFALNASILVAGNHLASILAGVAVLCTVFALRTPQFAAEAAGAGDQGLTFIYLAALFGEMPGGTWFFAPLFFLVLALAGLSSLVAMVELATRNVVDMGMPRQRAIRWVVLVGFVAGIPAALSLDYFANQDTVWGIALLISGLLAAMAMMRYGLARARADLDADSDFRVGAWWPALIRMFPVMFVALFGWFIWQSVTAGDAEWWNPFATFTLGAMLVQWVPIVVILLLLNRFLGNRVGAGPLTSVADSGTSPIRDRPVPDEG